MKKTELLTIVIMATHVLLLAFDAIFKSLAILS